MKKTFIGISLIYIFLAWLVFMMLGTKELLCYYPNSISAYLINDLKTYYAPIFSVAIVSSWLGMFLSYLGLKSITNN